jgi:hypothetical protein
VALIEVEGDTMTARQIVDVEDPISIVGTAGSQVFLVASGFGDGAYVLARGAGSWTATELEYAGPPPQLPGSAVVVERGALAGHVLLAENTAVRQLSLGADAVTDLGPVSLGDGFTAITGAIGVQP